MEAKYQRIILKISGEALSGNGQNIDVVRRVAKQVVEVNNMGVAVGIIVGGGNIWRGRQGRDMDRVTADHMGMLATVINSLALQDALEALGVSARVQTAIEMRQIAEPCGIWRRAEWLYSHVVQEIRILLQTQRQLSARRRWRRI